ncbi:MAG: purine-nucleoside phosphorylase [Rhizobiales bacterium]|nr:purine-nucleoside phosphorylase [Hyphomicrobiales bacterium]NRB14006.1 purine-nucleoside phosphorylase [Hyphomicrobiales bacterium]
MSIHIGAKPGDIAETVLLPGDPQRAKWVAETFLKDAVRYTTVRGMFGYTGTYKGHKVSVQGTGMGVPSISIYVNELFNEYGVKTAIRVGSAGALTADINVRDIVIAMTSSTDSSTNRHEMNDWDYAPAANFELLRDAAASAVKHGFTHHVGGIVTSDRFYATDNGPLMRIAEHGALAVEMETTALYTLAARYGCRALTVLTISDHLVTGADTTSLEREQTFGDMMTIALEAAFGE